MGNQCKCGEGKYRKVQIDTRTTPEGSSLWRCDSCNREYVKGPYPKRLKPELKLEPTRETSFSPLEIGEAIIRYLDALRFELKETKLDRDKLAGEIHYLQEKYNSVKINNSPPLFVIPESMFVNPSNGS